MDGIYDIDDVTRRELDELRGSPAEAGGVRVSPEAARVMSAAGMEPGELAARYLEDCVRSDRVGLVGYTLDPERRPRGAGAVHVVLDPGSRRITIYEEFY